jgi:hypothetical protein
MTKARDLSNIISGGFTADDIPNIDASKITTGTLADARISASSVSQHATSFDDNKIVNDISTLALRQASDANKSAYNTNSQFVDVFQDATGIDTTTNSTRNASEYVTTSLSGTGSNVLRTGDQRSNYTLTWTGFNIGGGDGETTILAWIDGNTGVSGSSPTSWHFYNESVTSSRWMQFQLDTPRNFTGFRLWQGGTSSNGNYKFQRSSDGTTWTDIGTFAWTASTSSGSYYYSDFNSFTAHNTDNLYYRILGDSGSDSSTHYQQEIQFYENELSYSATGNFTGTTITAPSSVSSMGAIITYQDNAGTNALNTDIVLELSADNGSNWSTATLSALPNFATGIKMAKVNDLAVTAGTQLKYRINFANQSLGSKEARIRGVALQY